MVIALALGKSGNHFASGSEYGEFLFLDELHHHGRRQGLAGASPMKVRGFRQRRRRIHQGQSSRRGPDALAWDTHRH